MQVGLLDVDGHNFPSIPLMKISAWHKQQGDDVEMYFPFYHYDRVYVSKVFSFTQDYEHPINAEEVIRGGTGYAISLCDGKEVFDKSKDEDLPNEIEHIYPDYGLYGITDTAYGFTSRGCPRGCGFCHVAAKEGKCSVKWANVDEFWRGQKYIQCCDPNILACKDKRDLLDQYAQTGAFVEFNQGLDIRLLTDDDAQDISRIKARNIHFAWDNPQDDLADRFKAFAESYKGVKANGHGDNGTVYCLTNFENCTVEEHKDRLLHRIYKLRKLNFKPFVMLYDKEHSASELRKIARWVNNPYIFYSTETYEQYKGAQ